MPRRPAAKPAEAEVEETEEIDLTTYVDKEVTPVAQAYTEWLSDRTGYNADERTVALAMALRRKFQHDEESRERIAEIREEREAARPKRAPKEEESDEEETPAAGAKATRARASRGSKVTSSSTTSKPAAARGAASRRGRGKAAATASEGAEAPF